MSCHRPGASQREGSTIITISIILWASALEASEGAEELQARAWAGWERWERSPSATDRPRRGRSPRPPACLRDRRISLFRRSRRRPRPNRSGDHTRTSTTTTRATTTRRRARYRPRAAHHPVEVEELGYRRPREPPGEHQGARGTPATVTVRGATTPTDLGATRRCSF